MVTCFDTASFINEIKNRPAIWDTRTDAYSDRDLKRQCWEEILDLFGDPELSTDAERKELGVILQRKWKNLRDCFSRELNRLRKLKSGTPGPRRTAYIYYNHLLFLRNVIQCKSSEKPEEAKEASSSETINCPGSSRLLTKKRKILVNPVEKRLINVFQRSIEKRDNHSHDLEEDEDRMFLLSLLKPLKSIPEELRLSTKIELMNVIDRTQKLSIYKSCSNEQLCSIKSEHSDESKYMVDEVEYVADSVADIYTDQEEICKSEPIEDSLQQSQLNVASPAADSTEIMSLTNLQETQS